MTKRTHDRRNLGQILTEAIDAGFRAALSGPTPAASDDEPEDSDSSRDPAGRRPLDGL